jgi:chitin synthase
VFTLALTGEITGASLSLSTAGIDTQAGLLNVPTEPGYRAFDVFYYLLTSQSEQEREFLGLKRPREYALLRKSDTYDPPSYLPTADDAAAAEDFRESLKAIGIKGSSLRSLLSVVAAVLRLGDVLGFMVNEEELAEVCEEVGGLLDLDPEVLFKKCSTEERDILIAALYEALVDWVVSKANEAIASEIRNGRAIGSSNGSDNGAHTPLGSLEDGDSVSITVIEVTSQVLGKAASLKTVFDDSNGINAEMKEDGVPIVPAGSSVIREMKEAVQQSEADLNISGGIEARDREISLDKRQGVLEKVGSESEDDSFLRQVLYPLDGQGIGLGKIGRFTLADVMGSSRVWFQLCLHPNEESPANFANQSPQNLPWSAGSVSSQIRSWRLPEWANYRSKQLDFTADFDVEEFVERYRRLGCLDGKDGVESWIMERGWSNGEVVVGHERIWMREPAYWEAESMLDMKPVDDMSQMNMLGGMVGAAGMEGGYPGPAGFDGPYYDDGNSVHTRQPSRAAPSRMGAKSLAPTTANTMRSISGGDYGLGYKGDDKRNYVGFEGEIDGELTEGKEMIVQKTTAGRRAWVALVWILTWWIPSPLMKWVGRMKRPDVRMAWREKVALMMLIALLNGTVVFYIVGFGKILCPNRDKVWNIKEVGYHQGSTDFYVAFRGGVYDLTKFYKLQHSDSNTKVTAADMMEFAGTDVSPYITPPLTIACPGLVTEQRVALTPNETLTFPQAEHTSGPQLQTDQTTALYNINWYTSNFLPRMKEYYKGQLVYKRSSVQKDGTNNNHQWFILNGQVYDLTDYFHTLDIMNNLPQYNFLPEDVTTLVQANPGSDITSKWVESVPDYTNRTNSLNCLNNRFKIGYTDFRQTARCQVNNYILLMFTIILCAVIVIKFLAALQLGSKKRPTQQDKFVICQVPAYTEGEDSLRKGLDSLTALAYDNKRKLICVICDGMIVGGGNDRPTPKIVLDILGVDPKIDPPALPFKSLGLGGEQLNYGKVYSGLYEFEGNVVPYIVVVKVGKESEQTKSKPGNRGKRDSQILLMSFLNRVHHRSAMNPLELEMFHQINNIIGVDPELYEYLFMVDADTKVKEDSLNRLVAACANDAKVAGICGETSLENEERSWTTMIQVYEYFISHHLAKAFESLFGSVTCLPGW